MTGRAPWTGRPARLAACLALALATVAAGCTAQRYELEKPGGTVEQERIDWGLCGGEFFPGNILIASENSAAVFRCMKDKGYTVAPIGLIQ